MYPFPQEQEHDPPGIPLTAMTQDSSQDPSTDSPSFLTISPLGTQSRFPHWF